MNSNRPDQTRPITFQWALALTFVAWFVEVILTMLLRPALLRSGMQPMAAASLIRVACYGLVFSTLLHASGLSYRKLFHEGRASVAATLGVLGPPILLMVPLILLLRTGHGRHRGAVPVFRRRCAHDHGDDERGHWHLGAGVRDRAVC